MKRWIAFLLAALMLLTVTGCGSSDNKETQPAEEAPKTVDLQALYDTLLAQMPEMILLDEDMMLNFCGIAPEDCKVARVSTCADGLRTDELWVIEAADADALARLTEMAETRLRMKGEESITYSPEQYAVVQKAELITEGLMLILIVSPDVETMTQTAMEALG